MATLEASSKKASLAESLDVRSVFGEISEVLRGGLPHDVLALTSWGEDGRSFRVYALAGATVDEPSFWEPLPIADADRAVLHRDPYLVHDVEAEVAPDTNRGRLLARVGAKSVLRVPLPLGSDVFGSLFFCARATDRYTEALALIDSRPQITVVISDTSVVDMSGMQFVDRLNALTLGRTRPRVLMLSEEPTLDAAVNALRLGVRDFVLKPVTPLNLIDAVRRAMAQAHGYLAASYARSPQAEALLRQAEELSGRLRILA